jgi:hypothetical protein
MHTHAVLSRSARVLIFPVSFCLSGCALGGAPSFDLFGAFFPAWLLCGTLGTIGAGVTRAVLVATGLSDVLPYQLLVCTAVGVIVALLCWLVGFG